MIRDAVIAKIKEDGNAKERSSKSAFDTHAL